MLYPFKFHPILKDRIWGGSYLCNELGKGADPKAKIGESWEISSLEGDVSVVGNGFLEGNSLTELIEIYMGDLLGEKVYEKFGIELPILIKFLDAEADLSVQVHPFEKHANANYDSHGKTEMWYVMKADKEAKLVAGFDKNTSRTEVRECIANNTVEALLRKDSTKPGDVFLLPAGRVHSLGAGNVVVEIQQSSDITFRVYDYNRMDVSGKPRELHVDNSLEVLNYTAEPDYKASYEKTVNQPSNLVKCQDFTANIISLNQKLGRDYYFLDSFVILICTEGEFDIDYEGGETVQMKKGESVLLPAQMREYFFSPTTQHATFIETYLEL
jgi:mannose-6-phosphate isomerase